MTLRLAPLAAALTMGLVVADIDKAHASKAPGDILLNQGELTNASRNRVT
jgi:hypothetical protein